MEPKQAQSRPAEAPQPPHAAPVQPQAHVAAPQQVATPVPQRAQALPPAKPAAPAPVLPQSGYLALPVAAVGRVDVGRLLREVEGLDNYLREAAIRQPGTAPAKLPKTSRLLDETIQSNGVNVLIEEDRNRLLHFLMEVYAHAPTLHMSFSADPTALFMQNLMTWLRKEIHPLVLVQVGLQPNMGAGCVVRTNNKYFDFSLRNRFSERRDVLVQRMKGAF